MTIRAHIYDTEGLEDSIEKKHTQGTDTTLGTLGTKEVPVNADKVIHRNSADSDELVTSTWTQIKEFFKTYFDTLYSEKSPTVNAIGNIGGGTQDIDLDDGEVVTATVDTSETTFTFSNPASSGSQSGFTLYLTNGGSQTVNWPASVDWAGGTAPSLTTAGLDALVFTTTDGGTTWYGFASGLDMS